MATRSALGYLAVWLVALAPLSIIGGVLVWRRRYEQQQLGLAALLLLGLGNGIAITTAVMVGFSLASIRWSLMAIGMASLVVSLVLRRLIDRDEVSVSRRAGAPTKIRSESVLAVCCAVAAMAASWAATIAGKASSPDLLWFWGPKAERYAAVGGIDWAFLKDPIHEYMHPAYPPLLPNLYAWMTMIAGQFSWRAVTLLFPILLTATWLLLRNVWIRQSGTRVGEVLAALAAGCMSLIGIRNGFGGIAEMPLLYFELAGISLLCLPKPTRAVQLWAGLSLAGAVLTKVEGIAAALPAIAVFVALQTAGTRLGALLLTAGPAAVGLATWFAFGRLYGAFSGYGGYGPLLEVHWANLPRVLAGMSDSLGSVAFGVPYWVPFLAGVGLKRLTIRMAIPLAAGTSLLCFLVFTYLHGDIDPYQWVGWSCGRVLSPIPGLLLIAIAVGYETEEAQDARDVGRRCASSDHDAVRGGLPSETTTGAS